ncbi:MAG: glycosyl hydrolase [Acidimicrobiales bacterium]
MRRAWVKYLGSIGWVVLATTCLVVGSAGVLAGAASASVVAALGSTLPSTSSAPSATDRPGGLIQQGDSKTTCISDGPAQLARDMRNTGVEYNCVETFSDADPTWADWVSPWIAGSGAPFVAWVRADPTGHQLIDTQNVIPDSEASNPDWTGECAAGDYDNYATQFARNMVAAGLGYTVIRLGHEMNGNWYKDSLGDTPTEWAQWGQCFAQEVTAMRAVAGAHFLFDWNVNSNYRDIPLADYYPGNAYVDIIGIDQYDNSGYPIPAPGTHRFAALAAEPGGLNDLVAFAAAHGKPLSIPEWGTTTEGLNAGGDDPYYVEGMAAFIASHDIAYESYFDANDDGVLPLDPSVAPLTVSAYSASIIAIGASSTDGAVTSGIDAASLEVVRRAHRAILLPTSGALLFGGTAIFARRRRGAKSKLAPPKWARWGAHSSGRPQHLRRERP